MDLPIERTLPDIRVALARRRLLVLQAPPGAGKTTRVPLALLDEPWLAGQRVVMLEPRRLAARAAARRMAQTLGERVGETVGYRVRSDTLIGPRTRIEVVTEGVLTRMLQSDPALEGVGLVIFDEFHERSVHADLGLALTLQSRSLLREELGILVMSATLEGGPVAKLLGDAPLVTSEGRAHPVETRYLSARWEGWIEPLVARTIEQALDEQEGDLLVFLPGAAEIRRVEERLLEAGVDRRARIAPLHGSLPQEAQDLAIAAARPGERKVVLSTSIAETSLTVEGVRVVIDAGRMRVPRFSPRTAMTRLETVVVSAASAEQRRGRAGRLGPGVCYRLWTEREQAGLVPHGTPEILDTDLAPLALELAAWGVSEPAELRWLDAPPTAAYAQARELLRALDALDEAGALTDHGRAMAGLGAHPRLAHMMLRGREMDVGALACELAALLSERDPIRGSGGPPPADVRLRVAALRGEGGGGVDRGALARVREEARRWRERLGVRAARGREDEGAAGILLALAYPDRIAQLRPGGGGRYLLRNGRGAAFGHPDSLATAPYLAAADLDDQGRESRILLAAPIEQAALEAQFGTHIAQEEEVVWDVEAGAVRARRREGLGAVVLREAPLQSPNADAVADALLGAVRQEGLSILPWTPAARQTRERLAFLHALDPSWPDPSDAALLATLDEWLRPHLNGIRRRDELQRLDLAALLRARLPWNRWAELDELAPSHVDVPSGSRIAIDYANPVAPVLAVRLQEVFGLPDTPRIARGRVPLTLHLLSPARRPVQVTRDLASFWSHAYFEVRKDLKGRYPKHPWPDDPLSAEATRRTKRNP